MEIAENCTNDTNLLPCCAFAGESVTVDTVTATHQHYAGSAVLRLNDDMVVIATKDGRRGAQMLLKVAQRIV